MPCRNSSTFSILIFIVEAAAVPADLFGACHPSQRLHLTNPDSAIDESSCHRAHAATIGRSLREANYSAHNVAALAAAANANGQQWGLTQRPDEVVNPYSVAKLMHMLMDFRWSSAAHTQPAPSDGDPLWTLISVFALGQSVHASKLEAVLGTSAFDAMNKCNILARCTTRPEIVSALVSLFPVPDTALIMTTDWEWTLANMTQNPVMFIGRDSTALVRNIPRPGEARVIDVCAGSGVQGLTALARGAEYVLMVDINPRAVRFMHFNTALNFMGSTQSKVTVLQKDLASLSVGSDYDILLANPPFVAVQSTGAVDKELLYESGGRDGEAVLRLVLQVAMAALKPGGQLAIVSHLYNPEHFHEHICSSLSVRGFDGSIVYDPQTVFSAEEAATARQSGEVGKALARHYRDVGIHTMVEGFVFAWRHDETDGGCRFRFHSNYQPWYNLPAHEQTKDAKSRPCATGRDGVETCQLFSASDGGAAQGEGEL